MRRAALASVIVLSAALPSPVEAQEPLFLRIRPAAPDAGSAAAGIDDEAADARARSEAVWQRSERRARLAIASVCRGCLGDAAPPEFGPAADPASRVGGPAAASVLSIADSR